MESPRMTLKEVLDDMRNRGMGINTVTFNKYLDRGFFPFIEIVNVGETGRRTFLIFRSEYEAWANKFFGGKYEPRRSKKHRRSRT